MEARRAAYTSPTAQVPKSPPPPPPPPPIHARTASVTRPSNLSAPPVSVGARPPVVRRDSRPDSTMSVKATSPPPPPPPPARSISSIPRSPTQENEIDWAHLSAKDKEVFFSWLDEFFSRQLNITIPPRSAGPTVQSTGRPSAPPRPVRILRLSLCLFETHVSGCSLRSTCPPAPHFNRNQLVSA